MRQPAVADRFYPGSPKALSLALSELFDASKSPIKKEKALVAVCPHAGYVYSGSLAAETLNAIEIPKTVIILGPNHRGQGAPVALSTKTWDMPHGKVPMARESADCLLERFPEIREDDLAHKHEHSLEVQIPFLQLLQNHLRIVPLVLSHISFPLCERLAEALADCIRKSNDEILIVASTDMSHYEPRSSAATKDALALQCIEKLDPYQLYRTVIDQRISMCGVIPVVVAMLSAISCGAKKSRLVGYTDSGHVSGDTTQVVGYAGIIIS